MHERKASDPIQVRPDYLAFGPPDFTGEEIAAVTRVMRSGWVGMRPEVVAFEEELAAFIGAPQVVTVNSYTSALHLSLLVSGVGPGDDVIEHLAKPEHFMDELRRSMTPTPKAKLVISTGNVAFIATRLMLLLGNFNYGKKGILDLTHTRLFTFRTMQSLLGESGFKILEVRGIPAPFPLVFGHGRLGRLLLGCNRLLIRLSKGLFSYQMIIVAEPMPSLDSLLADAVNCSEIRSGLKTG
jgi:hypothetical protein